MAGSAALRYLQLGKETTPGTIVAATTIWRGTALAAPEAATIFPEEDTGYFGDVNRGYVPKIGATVAMPATPMTFEQLPYILSAGVKNVTTGVTDSGSSPSAKIYAYPFSTTSANTITTWTAEIGDDNQGEVMEYAFVESFKLTGKYGQAWMMEAAWRGRQLALQAKTGSLTIPTIEEVLFQNTVLYIDAVGGTIGTTQVASTLLDATINVKTGFVARWTADGNLYFNTHVLGKPDITVDMTFLYNSSAVTERSNWRSKTARQIRLQATGSNMTAPGSTYTKRTVRMDFAGRWEKFDKLGEDSGNDVISATFRPRYDSTAALFASITSVCDGLASLP